MLPIYEIIFHKKTPRISPEAKIELLRVGNYFGEELFTYVQIFGNIHNPHVLPLYVPNKILPREIIYQTMGSGISKVLK